MPTSQQVVKQLRKQARRIWRSRRQRVGLAAFFLLLICSLGFGAALLQQQPQQTHAVVEENGDIEMEVDARGEWERPQPRSSIPTRDKAATVETVRAEAAVQAQPVGPAREVKAAWYDVPDDSLAKRRAGREELTAAHNRLPLGTLVRVTHLTNGKSTLVRITDRGIRDKAIKLDVCREAAEELGMVKKGIARVKMEIVREESSAGEPPVHHTRATP